MKCKKNVLVSGTYRSSQCSRNAVKDGYCKQHHPDSVKLRREKSEKLHAKKLEKSPLRMAFKTIEQLRKRVKELEHNLVDWNRSQITDRNRIKELEVMLRKLVPETQDLLDCVHSEYCGFKCNCADSNASKLITEAEQLYKKEAGFKDDS